MSLQRSPFPLLQHHIIYPLYKPRHSSFNISKQKKSRESRISVAIKQDIKKPLQVI